MCGIAGIFDPAGRESDASLAARCRDMAGRLRHRGPDAASTWTDAAAGIGFGHRRLSVIDLSPAGDQPMISASGRFVLNYNGEVYNFRDLRRRLEQQGTGFRGASDTEVFLEAIAAWGVEEALRHADGMFAFALWDRRERTLCLARDRMGQKPLYYGWAGKALAFASELKAIDAAGRAPRKLDRQALALYLQYSYIPAPRTIWEEFRKLPPGQYVTISSGDVAARQLPDPVSYWSLRHLAETRKAQPAPDERDQVEALDSRLRGAVRRCMVADVPLGVFLSGGVDSSSIAALMQNLSGDAVRSFTIGFRDRDHDEAAHARSVARHLGTEHTDLHVDEADARAIITLLPEIYDEPFGDSSQIPAYLVSRLARQHVTVALSGDGADELFGGYNRHVWADTMPDAAGRFGRSARAALAGAIRVIPAGLVDGIAAVLPARIRSPQASDKMRKLGRALGAASPEAAYRRLVSAWDDSGEAVAGLGPYAPDVPVWPGLDSAAESMMLLDAENYLPGDILTKVDRASMAVSLEVRAPFLDREVVEFAWTLPPSMRIRNGQGKWLLREMLARYVPRGLTDRPKAGFAVPIGVWLRGPLRDWAETLLGEERLRKEGILEPAPVRRLWEEHRSGRGSHQSAIWNVLMLLTWLERHRA